MNILAGLSTALCIGSADFFGGLSARRVNAATVALWINVVAAVALVLAAALVGVRLSAAEAAAAALGGAISANAISLGYASLAAGAMSLTAPFLACGTALVPIAAATAVGETPDPRQGLGIFLVLLSIAAITWRPNPRAGHASLSGRALGKTAIAALMGGSSFAVLQLAARGRADTAFGVAVISRCAALVVCVTFVLVAGRAVRPTRAAAPPILAAGCFETIGTTLSLIASSLGNTAVVAVVVSLYAVVTVVLAQVVLRERVAPHQGLGIVAMGLGVALLST